MYEFLENVKEYPTYLKEAGLNAEQFVAISTNATKQGIFSDKGLKMTINILDADAQSIKEYSKEGVPVKRNNITQTNISMQQHFHII